MRSKWQPPPVRRESSTEDRICPYPWPGRNVSQTVADNLWGAPDRAGEFHIARWAWQWPRHGRENSSAIYKNLNYPFLPTPVRADHRTAQATCAAFAE